jgi:prepilin-type N-terminal cleavage/methylation domain-containing protein
MRVEMSLDRIWNRKGVTVVELLIALAISTLLISVLYRTFISQQKAYTVQEQVVDMQQNVRVAINKMMREIRMAGFGNVATILSLPGGVNGFVDAITPDANSITLVEGLRQISTLGMDAEAGQNKITLTSATGASELDGATYHRYISIGGLESNIVLSRSGRELTVQEPLKMRHPLNTPIFKVHAITYGIRQNEGVPVLFRDLYSNTAGSQRITVAENIEGLQFEYFDGGGNLLALPIENPGLIRRVRVTVTARTIRSDSDFPGGDGLRRRTVASNIDIRNLRLSE